MILSLLRHSGWLALLAACGGAVACNSASNPPADVFMIATVGPTAAHTCPMPTTTNVVVIGAATGGKPTTVNDQGTTASGQVSVTCTVHPSGNGFDLDLETNAQGTSGGSVVITTPTGAGTVTTGTSSGITAHFEGNAVGGPYVDSNCTLTYKYMNADVPVSPPVAAGRIWGHLVCNHALDPSQQKVGADGGPSSAECLATADFLFEQCAQ